MSELLPHTLARPYDLIECDVVIDVGAGIRPMNWYKPKRHHCIEPHPIYADVLQVAGYRVWRGTAIYWLPVFDPENDESQKAIYFLDSLEHMTKAVGLEALRLARACDPSQIIVFTPNGFSEQHGDAWGLGGELWQDHRSGWTAADFPGWRTEIDAQTGGLLAVWTAS